MGTLVIATRTRFGPWTFSMISYSMDATSASWRSWIPSRDCRRRSMCANNFVAVMSLKHSAGYRRGRLSDNDPARQRTGIHQQELDLWAFMRGWRSTSAGPASRRTMPSSKAILWVRRRKLRVLNGSAVRRMHWGMLSPRLPSRTPGRRLAHYRPALGGTWPAVNDDDRAKSAYLSSQRQRRRRTSRLRQHITCLPSQPRWGASAKYVWTVCTNFSIIVKF